MASTQYPHDGCRGHSSNIHQILQLIDVPMNIEGIFKRYRPETILHIDQLIVARRRWHDLQHSKVQQTVSSVDGTVHVQIYRHAYGYKHT